jgi:hypothetical protein
MDPEGRERRFGRRSWLLASLAIPLSRLCAAPALSVRRDGDMLRVAAPNLHFLSGKPLESLKDGATVIFLAQLSILVDNRLTVMRRAPFRFAVSFDLWEERFRVTETGPTPRAAERLTEAAAEAFCLDGLAISSQLLAADRPFWLRLEMRLADRDLASVLDDPGINLTRLIEVFSRRSGGEAPRWVLEAGPLRLADLGRPAGAKNG